jgi:hypothetical protein
MGEGRVDSSGTWPPLTARRVHARTREIEIFVFLKNPELLKKRAPRATPPGAVSEHADFAEERGPCSNPSSFENTIF